MTIIEIKTNIKSTPQTLFDLSLSVDFHKYSLANTKEEAIAGRTSGLCEYRDEITWEATHFGIRQRLSVVISKFDRPYFFEDKMTKGAFKSMRHEHFFEPIDTGTLMTDKFYYEVPFGICGRIFDKLILKRYMTKFLMQRNRFLKEIVENQAVDFSK